MNDELEQYEYLELIKNDLAVDAPFLCKLPTGEPVLYRIPFFEKGKVHTRVIHAFRRAMRHPKKQFHPNAMLKGKHSSLICIDIDGISEWSASRLLGLHAEGKIECFRSPSGNVKAFLSVVHLGHSITKMDAVETVREVCGDEIASQLDLGGLFTCFLNNDAVEAMNNAVAHPIELIRAKKDTVAFVPKPLPFWVEDRIKMEFGKNMAPFVSKLLTWAKRGTNGTLFIPQKWWADALGVSQSTISRWIDKLIEMGLLEVEDDGYKGGSYSKRYRFAGWLKEVSEQILSFTATLRSQGKTIVCRPDSPSNGNWNDALWKMANFFKNGLDYLNAVSSWAGFTQKDRRGRAKDTWNHHAKRNGLATI